MEPLELRPTTSGKPPFALFKIERQIAGALPTDLVAQASGGLGPEEPTVGCKRPHLGARDTPNVSPRGYSR